MKRIAFAALGACSCVLSLASAAEPRAPSDAEIRYKQAIGRALVSPNGQFFVYEWMRPYNWVRDTGPIPKPAAERLQTWLYRVDLDRTPANSEYVFFPGSGASYWLGAFSADGRHLSFYELDNDNNVLKTGAVTFTDPITPKLTWFNAPPDGTKLDQPPVWIASDEFVYPAESGLVRAKIPEEKKPDESLPINRVDYDKPTPTQACGDCASLVAQAKQAAAKVAKKKPGKAPADSRLIAQSADGELEVYERSNKKVIGVLFRKGADAEETVVFENERVLPPWSPPKWPDRKEKPVAEAATSSEAKATK